MPREEVILLHEAPGRCGSSGELPKADPGNSLERVFIAAVFESTRNKETFSNGVSAIASASARACAPSRLNNTMRVLQGSPLMHRKRMMRDLDHMQCR